MLEKLTTFALPDSAWLVVVSALGLVFLAPTLPESLTARFRGALGRLHSRDGTLAALLLATLAAFLSRLYFLHYLEASPRVIDAAAYLLEGRILSHGSFTFQVPEPTSLFHGRFLVTPPEHAHEVGVLFPPGYPALLAVGELLGSYELVGPSLAALLAFYTHRLALRVSGSTTAALVAGALSAVNATLRYHTADTMSHGWSALLVLLLANNRFAPSSGTLGKSREKRPFLFGLGLGLLLATRQLTGVAFGAAFLLDDWIERRRAAPRPSARNVLFLGLGLVPGIALLLLHHRALTGNFWVSPQMAYYAVADGPKGCFGLGLGKGCEYEHGDFFRETEGRGLTLGFALRATLRRVGMHLGDIANFEPLGLLVPFAWWRRRDAFSRLSLLCAVLLLPLYAGFYFDGNYPGGGARFLSELLPLEHVLLACVATEMRQGRRLVALALLGYSLHGRLAHESLKNVFGPGPYVTRQELRELDRRSSLLFVESDHAFLLASDPRPVSERRRTVAYRSGDEREAFLVNELRAEAVYRLRGGRADGARLLPYVARQADDSRHILEAEGFWPPLSQQGLWVHPAYPAESCVSRGRGLRVHFEPSPAPMGFTLRLDGLPPGRYRLEALWAEKGAGCFTTPLGESELPGPVTLHPPISGSSEISLDLLEARPVPSAR